MVRQDNWIDLVPQETVAVGVTGLMERGTFVRRLCEWEPLAKADGIKDKVTGSALHL